MRLLFFTFLPLVFSFSCNQNILSQSNKKEKMLTYEEAKSSAKNFITDTLKYDDTDIWEEKTVAKSYGWFFVLATKQFLATKDKAFSKPGTPSLLVEKSGHIITLGTFKPLYQHIKEFDEKFSPHSKNSTN